MKTNRSQCALPSDLSDKLQLVGDANDHVSAEESVTLGLEGFGTLATTLSMSHISL